MIIDFHTHIYPDSTAANTLAAVCERAGVTHYTDGTLNGLLASMRDAGIDRCVICSVATRPEQVEPIHQWLQGIRQPSIYPLATVHPDVPINANFIGILKAQGFKGIKVHPDYQGFFIDEKAIYPLYEAAQAEEMAILFHMGFDPGLPSPVHSTPTRMARVLKDFPRLPIIAAHLGGDGMHEETERYLLGKDIYLDTSFVLQKMPMAIVERIFAKHPVERFLFGTDSPWTNQKDELNFFLSLPFLNNEEKEKITSTNPARLLGLL